ncbi:MAG: outer membrane lipid asymmetry maintenance protein MlaD [Rhodospirillaceae bacterium]|nr:outer membrane lipid asymmetry maintenance protein MlaD [Rhodospirillaceae bacterium]
MTRRNPIETVLGAVVLVIAAMFLAFAYSAADLRAVTGYDVTATFLKVGGLERGSDVRISGINVGTVTGQHLDPQTFEAKVTMSISSDVKLPADTTAAIVSDGLLGGKYINLVPGQAAERIAAGGSIARTRDFQSLEDLVGEIIFLATNSGNGGGASAPTMPAPQ